MYPICNGLTRADPPYLPWEGTITPHLRFGSYHGNQTKVICPALGNTCKAFCAALSSIICINWQSVVLAELRSMRRVTGTIVSSTEVMFASTQVLGMCWGTRGQWQPPSPCAPPASCSSAPTSQHMKSRYSSAMLRPHASEQASSYAQVIMRRNNMSA